MLLCGCGLFVHDLTQSMIGHNNLQVVPILSTGYCRARQQYHCMSAVHEVSMRIKLL